jgi:hypothetical protein
MSTVRKIGSFGTVQEFWRTYHVLSDIDALPKQTSLQLFRSGIQPLWEDPANARGGRWMIPVPRESAVAVWTALVVALVSEQFAWSGECCGIVLSLKPSQATVRLWNRDAEKIPLEDCTREIQELTGLQDMSYQAHQATSCDAVRTFGNMRPMPARRRRRRRGRKHSSQPDMSVAAAAAVATASAAAAVTVAGDEEDEEDFGSPP